MTAAPFKKILQRARGASPFMAAVFDRDLEGFAERVDEGWFAAAWKPGAIAKNLQRALKKNDSDDQFMAALRRLRAEETARIALRDIASWAPLDETLGALSELAEASCEAALAHAQRGLVARHGTPRDEAGAEVKAFVLGMGKLGGRELNFSSDIDLILGYTASGETDGKTSIANEQFFEKLVRSFTNLLSQRTADGFVFRVDWLLRPFGASGPPAMTVSAMEEYYQRHGREWERYAFIKARCVAGDRKAGEALLKALQPFVYRRYLDFNAVGALREMKRMIEAEVARKELHDNVKLGAGGIREIEFIVQAFQLMRGGQEPALRDTRLRPVLKYLGQAGHLPAETCASLDEAYVFLRRLENAIQMRHDEQRHELPEDEEGRESLRLALDISSWAKLEAELQSVRAHVVREFKRLFTAPQEHDRRDGPGAAAVLLWSAQVDAKAASAAVAALGYTQEPDAVVSDVRELREARMTRALAETELLRLEALVAQLLAEAAREREPEVVLRRALEIVSAVIGRSTYVTLLRESAKARAQLLRLCAASPWIAQFIAQTPALLDGLLDERALYAPPERAEMRAELEEVFANVDLDDTEGAMNALRLFRREMTLRIAASDLVQALPLVKVSDRLTWLAEVILEKALALNREALTREFGAPQRADGSAVAFGVIAYGKFGGIEMGYGSDLDIVFVHDCDALAMETSGGKRRLANEVWLARLAQRTIHWLSTQTSAGRAYEVDLELRPDGRRGLTVSTLEAFAQYQRQSAWTWEHQALTRARPVAGEARIQDAFRRVRAEVLTRARDGDKLRAEVRDMRAKMVAHLDRGGGERFDVKHSPGGLTDIEFITQYLVLRHAHAHPALVEWSDNWRQTDALVAAGVLTAAQARVLIDSYREYRTWLHTRDLQQAETIADDSAFAATRAAVRAVWQEIIE